MCPCNLNTEKGKIMNWESLNEQELFGELINLRNAWNENNGLANDDNECDKYQIIKRLLEVKFLTKVELFRNDDKSGGKKTPYEVRTY
jgi:hypothetical protein